jgi:hypothetical protein
VVHQQVPAVRKHTKIQQQARATTGVTADSTCDATDA